LIHSTQKYLYVRDYNVRHTMHLSRAATLACLFAALSAATTRSALTVLERSDTSALNSRPVACIAQLRSGDALSYVVDDEGFRIVNATHLARKPFGGVKRAFSNVTSNYLGASPACAVTRDMLTNRTLLLMVVHVGGTLNGSEIAVLAVDAATLETVRLGAPSALLGFARAADGAARLPLRACAWDAARRALFVTTGAVECAASRGAPLLLRYDVATDVFGAYTFLGALSFDGGATRVDLRNASAASLVKMESGALVLGLGDFAPQPISRTDTLRLNAPLVLVLDAALTSFSASLTRLAPGYTTRYGATASAACAAPRWSAVTLGHTLILPSGEMALGEITLRLGGARGTTILATQRAFSPVTRGPFFAGACAWDADQSALVRIVHTKSTAHPLRLAMPSLAPPSFLFSYEAGAPFSLASASTNSSDATMEIVDDTRSDIAMLDAPVDVTARYFSWDAAATKNEAARVLGGADAAIEAAPHACHVVTLVGLCSCSILDAWHVLTAAHCVPLGALELDTARVAPYVVYTGSSHTFGGLATTARRSATHPSALFFTSLESADVAVIYLDAPLDLSTPRQRAIARAHSSARSRVGADVEIYGFGLLSDNATDVAHTMQRMRGRVASELEGTQRKFRVVGNGGAATCHGDSGAGVVARDFSGALTLVGVVSYGTVAACALADNYEADTGVESVDAWISALVADTSAGARARNYPLRYPQQFRDVAPHAGHVALHTRCVTSVAECVWPANTSLARSDTFTVTFERAAAPPRNETRAMTLWYVALLPVRAAPLAAPLAAAALLVAVAIALIQTDDARVRVPRKRV
jgi:hypothetical protein